MIPNNSLSSVKQVAPFLGARVAPDFVLLNDRETANIPVSAFVYEPQDWTASCDGSNIVLHSVGQTDIAAVTDTGITEISFTFDQNKNYIVAYVANGVAKLNWYDATIPARTTTTLGSTYFSPRVSLDNKSRMASATNDVILAYIRNGQLRYRQQRDKYATEYVLATLTQNTRLRRIGMNSVNRLQFEYYEMFDPAISQLT